MQRFVNTRRPSRLFIMLGLLACGALLVLAWRFMFGLGAVTHLNNGYPWGLWVVFDIVIGTGFACGSYVLALLVYILNKGRYHPLIRSALLASLCGYTLAGVSALFDMGRYWQFYNVFDPAYQNFNSVMLEVSLCVTAYILVLVIENLPLMVRSSRFASLRARLDQLLFVLIALGVLLASMHQSSLGSLLIIVGQRIMPLWQAFELMPLLSLLSAMLMGFCAVTLTCWRSTKDASAVSATTLLAGLGSAISWLLLAYLMVRFGELAINQKLGLIVAGDFYGNLFLLETLLFTLPLLTLQFDRQNHGRRRLLLAVGLTLAGAALYRLNGFLLAFNPGGNYSYFPAASEFMVSIGMIAIEVMVLLWVLNRQALYRPAAV